MSQETISSLLIELGLDTKDFDTSLKNVNKSTKAMEQSFNGAKKALALSEKGVEDYTKAINSGEGVIKQYQSKIDALGSAYKEQEQKLKGYLQQQKELPATISKAEQELKQLEQSLGKSSSEYKKAENELKTYKQQLAGMDTTINKSVNSMRSLENQIQNTKNRMSQAENEVGQFRNELRQLDGIDLDGVGSIFDSMKESIGNIDLGNFTSQIDGLDGGLDLLSLGAKGAGLALAGMLVASTINSAKEYDKILTDLQITMGLTEGKASDLQKKIMSFADGGYNIENIGEAVQLLSQRFQMTDGEMEKVSQGMSVLNNYGYETNDMVRFITMAYDNWGMTANDALGMIIRGQQNGMNIAGDLMDTFIEYTPILGQMGISGQDAFNLISSAMQTTGMDSDKVADMIKELTLTITDGSDSSAKALSGIGINVNDLTSRIDSGKITMADAFKEVSTAILNVKDETARATALQDIFKGTVEYGNQSVLESWVSVKNETMNTTSAIDEVTTAYENSYQASQQDFSNSWSELSQTLGSLVLPLLTEVMNSMTRVINVTGISLSTFGIQIQTWSNQLKAFFQEVGIGILESLANLPFAEKIMPNLDSTLSSMKTNHEETIKYIQNNERLMKENAKLVDAEYATNKEQTFSNVANTANQKTKEMANAVSTNTADARNNAKTNTDGLKSDVEGALSGLGNVALTSTGEIPKATQQNLSTSSQIIRQFGTDAYNGVKTSFSKLEQSAKQSMTNLYNGCNTSMSKTKTNVMQDATTMYNQSKKSFNSLAQAGRQAFSNLYNGVTTSSSRMRNQVIADWNSIRNTLSKGITGKVSVTKTVSTVSATPKAITPIDSANQAMARLNTDNLNYRASSYQPTKIVSSSSIKADKVNNDTIAELKNQNKLLTQMLEVLMSERTTLVENTINLDGRAIAKGTAKYMDTELTTINNRKIRLAGSF